VGIFFEKYVSQFRRNPKTKIYNKRIQISEFTILKRIDLTFMSEETYTPAEYPYLDEIRFLKQILPLPEFLLKAIKGYKLPYEMTDTDKIDFKGKKTVIYLHGVGGFTEENSVLHRQLVEHGCNLIRITYSVDYEKEGINYPKKAEDMLPFIHEFETKIGPILDNELIKLISNLKADYPDLFNNKEIVLIAHSIGAGIIANLAASCNAVKFDKFVNLDGTLLNPSVKNGLKISELHLSQDSMFKDSWITEEDSKEPLKAIGQDYCKRINAFINNSSNRNIWIQIKDSTHFTFTDFPNIMKSYKIFKKIAGTREAAKRIRDYVIEYIDYSDVLKVDANDHVIKNTASTLLIAQYLK
jgi:hypothetical protein